MATIKSKLLKCGKYSDTIQIKVKDETTGKSKFISKTYPRPDNIRTKNELDRYLKKIESEFETQERIRIKEKKNNASQIKFSELAEDWHKRSFGKDSPTYYYKQTRIIDYLNYFLGDKFVKDISARDVQEILFKLNTYEYEISKAVLIKPLDDIIANMKIKNICQNGNFTKTTFQFVRKGKQIDWTTAMGVAKALNIDIKKYFEKITIKKKYEKETKLKYKRVLSAILNYGIKCEYCTTNYCSGFYTKGILSGEKKEKVILNQNEYIQLQEGIKTMDIPNNFKKISTLKKRTYVAVLLYLGLRNCEACGLEWRDIDFENGKISILRDSLYIKELGTYTTRTKNDYSKRVLKIPKKLMPYLEKYKQCYEEERQNWGDRWENSDRLFIKFDGSPCNPTSCGKWLAELLLSFGMRKVSPHALRHTNITILLRNGVSAKIVAKWAGHANPAVTLSTYAHFLDEDENISADCIDKILG